MGYGIYERPREDTGYRYKDTCLLPVQGTRAKFDCVPTPPVPLSFRSFSLSRDIPPPYCQCSGLSVHVCRSVLFHQRPTDRQIAIAIARHAHTS